MRICFQCLLFLFVFFGFDVASAEDPQNLAAMQSEARHALVIGNSAYERIPLANPVNDANAMATALAQCGFVVDKRLNASRAEMAAALETFAAHIQKGGVGLFYFAGHGFQINTQNYLLPADISSLKPAELEQKTLNVSQVLQRMEAARNRINILILDACRNNPFTANAQQQGGASGLAPMYAATATGSFIAYATAPGRTASDGLGQNGLYTSYLLKALHKAGARIETVFKEVRKGVVQDTRGNQTPWESTSIVDDFYFSLGVSKQDKLEEPLPQKTLPPAMVRIPTSEFITGPVGGWLDERKIKRILLQSYLMDRYEVSVGQYKAFAAETKTKLPLKLRTARLQDQHPVVGVTWDEAEAYCQWVGKRLPTEEEWEKAARGSDGRAYPWGDREPDATLANFGDADGPEPVDAYAAGASPYGVVNLVGNVWEWTATSIGKMRVVRGGAWDRDAGSPLDEEGMPREKLLASMRRHNVGFRCVQ